MTGGEWSTIAGIDAQLSFWRSALKHPAYRHRQWEIWISIDTLLEQRTILAAHGGEEAA